MIDTDSGFIKVLTKRLEGAGWQHRVLSTPVPPEELVAMKLNAVVVDMGTLGTDAWDYLERICGMLPELGVVVCTGQVDGRAAGPGPEARRRRLGRQAVPPGGGHRSAGGRRSPPPPQPDPVRRRAR